MNYVQKSLLLALILLVGGKPVQAQDCRLWEDNYFCYNGTVACPDSIAQYSSAGQAGTVTQYSCSVATVSYFGVCDSGNSPQDDQFVLTINNQVVSENVIDTRSEYVKIYPITLQPGLYPVDLSVLRDSDPPGTYRIVASTSPSEVESQLAEVCGTDFAATSFEAEGSGRLITAPVPLVVYASRRTDFNGDGALTNEDGSNLYLYDIYRNLEVQLTDPSALDYDPSWSPDGSSVVFASEGRQVGESAIFTVPVMGGAPQALTDGSISYWHPEYSPDGRTLAATCYQNSICLMNPDGTNVRTILSVQGQYFWDPNWSPDGRQLLIIGRIQDTNNSGRVDGCDQSALFTIQADGSGLTRVTHGSYYVFGGDWSADGSRIIYYAAWETGNGHQCAYNDEAALGIIDRATGAENILIPRGRFLRTPAFSLDMNWATFTAPNFDDNRDGYLDARDRESLVMFTFQDGTQRRLTLTQYEIFDPAWAPSHITSLPGH